MKGTDTINVTSYKWMNYDSTDYDTMIITVYDTDYDTIEQDTMYVSVWPVPSSSVLLA